jgi:hypothetical protein
MFVVYLSGGQEVRVEDARDLRVEVAERFPGSDEATVLCVGEDEIVLARFRAGAVIGYREQAG